MNNLAVLYHQVGDYELASEAYEDGLACARSSHNQRAASLLLTGLGDLYAEIEDFEAASQAYEQAESIASELTGFFVSNYLVLAHANLALLQEDFTNLSQILKFFRKKLDTNPSVYERGLWALLEGRSLSFKCIIQRKQSPSYRKGKVALYRMEGNPESQWCIDLVDSCL